MYHNALGALVDNSEGFIVSIYSSSFSSGTLTSSSSSAGSNSIISSSTTTFLGVVEE